MKEPMHPDDIMRAIILFFLIATVGVSMAVKDHKEPATQFAERHLF